jgi:hypothetical protein
VAQVMILFQFLYFGQILDVCTRVFTSDQI